jgi:hypothetical protein
MAALIGSRPDLLPDFHCTLAPALIRRFKEREENVKADIFGAYIVLLRQTRPPRGWLEAVEEPTQTGSNLHMLRAQVGMPLPTHLFPTPPFTSPPSHPSCWVCIEHLSCTWSCVQFSSSPCTLDCTGQSRAGSQKP